MELVLAGVAVSIDGCPIVADAALEVHPGEFVGLVGPNGCGKSTLLRSIYRALRPTAGLISLDDDDLWRLPAREYLRDGRRPDRRQRHADGVLTPDRITELFGVRAHKWTHPGSGRPVFAFDELDSAPSRDRVDGAATPASATAE